MDETKRHRRRRFFHNHSLSIISVAVLTLWIICYCYSDPATHLGAFFGNAIADWSGSVIIILARNICWSTNPSKAAERKIRTD